MKNILFALMLLGSLKGSGQLNSIQLTPRESELITDFGKKLTKDIANDNLNGSISGAIIKNDHVIWAGAFGYASTINNAYADTNTIYRIGSITKTFTATLLMQMVEAEIVKLDEPAEKYLPEVKNIHGYSDDTKFTLRQLASHTSGLEREPDMDNANIGPVEEWQNKVILAITHTSFNSKPGKKFLYSNIGYAVLGLALERAAGVPYIQLVQEKILNPLHMENTFFELSNEKLPKLAQGILNIPEGKVDLNQPLKEIGGRGFRVPNGSLFSTPLDLSKLLITIMTKPYLLNVVSLEEMQTVPAGGYHYGLGLMLVYNNRNQLEIIRHNGVVAGYTAQFSINKINGYAVILMRNYNSGGTNLDLTAINLLKKLGK